MNNVEGPISVGNTEDELEDLLDLEESICTLISDLSSDHDLPVKAPKPSQTIPAEEISFRNNSWISATFDIQGWLNLNEKLDRKLLDGEPLIATGALLTALGQEAHEPLLTTERNVVRLTAEGLGLLNQRLSDANSARQTYRELLDDGESKSIAKRAWEAKWEEFESGYGSEPEEAIRASTEQQRIQYFASSAEQKTLDLSPSYQRSDVWTTADAQKLIESVMLGIPLPSVIILEKDDEDAPREVVDGKQRLTSILRFMGAHPEALRIIDAKQEELDAKEQDISLRDIFQTDYKEFKKIWKAINNGEVLTDKVARRYFFPFKTRTSPSTKYPLKHVAGKYYTEVMDEKLLIGQKREKVSTIFNSGGSDYYIPLIKFKNSSPKQIHSVFHLYNKQGKHLNAEEIRNAVHHSVKLLQMLHALSGDGKNREVLAAFLCADDKRKQYFETISAVLSDYHLTQGRYKATKILSWIVSAALRSTSRGQSTEPTVKSTATLIDDLLTSISDKSASSLAYQRLEEEETLLSLADSLNIAVRAHATFRDECFPEEFRGTGQTWDELQLVGTMIGFFLITTSVSDAEDRIENSIVQIRNFLMLDESARPTSAQNKTQWAFISKIALGLAECCGLTVEEIDKSVRIKYGVSAVKDTMQPFRSIQHR
jgi:hypothetical protein